MPGTNLVKKNLYDLSVDDTSLFQDIREKVWDRVLRRLESSSVIDDTHLFRVFADINKVQLALESKVVDRRDEKQIEIISLVKDDGIPLEHRQKLLDDLEERGVEVGEFRKHLTKGNENGSEA